MPDYDFTNLSPIDLEVLARDLLQEELHLTFESFTSGRDLGIDFRYCPTPDLNVIVQCKHYARSTLSRLLNELKTKELEKIQKLQPHRYILVTSLPLTPSNKEEIQQVLTPFISTSGDIIGKNELNNLLGKFPHIERQHFKLWLSSIQAFEEILHSKVKNVSRNALQKIREHARYYVQNDSFKEALEILTKHNLCIIAGIPGIGKTMLAEMLVLHFVDANYEIVKVTSNISEAVGLNQPSLSRVFYYDDFLGQHSLGEKLDKNEDVELLDFIYAIRKSKTEKLILTTREYILSQAKLRYEKLERSNFRAEIYVIDLSKYTRLNKAKILFNHLYFSDLPNEHKNKLLANRSYLKIVDHRNYNPRIVELMTEFTRVSDIGSEQYLHFFLSNLDNPFLIWSHAFERQLSDASKDLLMTMASLPSEVFLEDCKEAFEAFHSNQAMRYGFRRSPREFRDALKELDGNFVSTEKSRERILLRFHNPSVKDFVLNYLSSHEEELISLLHSCVFFNQLTLLWSIEDRGTPMFRRNLSKSGSTLLAVAQRTFGSRDCRLISYKDTNNKGESYKGTWSTSVEERASVIAGLVASTPSAEATVFLNSIIETVSERIKTEQVSRRETVDLLKEIKKSGLAKSANVQALLGEAKRLLLQRSEWLWDFDAARDFAKSFPKLVTKLQRQKIRAAFQRGVAVRIRKFLDPNHKTDANNVRLEIYFIRDLSKKFRMRPPDALRKLESLAENLEAASSASVDEVRGTYVGDEPHECSDAEIDSIFNTLDIESE